LTGPTAQAASFAVHELIDRELVCPRWHLYHLTVRPERPKMFWVWPLQLLNSTAIVEFTWVGRRGHGFKRNNNLFTGCVTSHAFTPQTSEFGRDVVIISYHGRPDSYFGCPARSSFRKNFPWLMAGSMGRRARGSRWDPNSASISSITRVQSITNSEFSITDLSSFGEEESSIPVSSCVELGLRRWKASSVGVFRTEYLVRGPSVGVVPEWLLEWIDYMWSGRRSDAEWRNVCWMNEIYV